MLAIAAEFDLVTGLLAVFAAVLSVPPAGFDHAVA
jgi:hypothetical protein